MRTTGSPNRGERIRDCLESVNKIDCEKEMSSLSEKRTEKEILQLLGYVEEENSG